MIRRVFLDEDDALETTLDWYCNWKPRLDIQGEYEGQQVVQLSFICYKYVDIFEVAVTTDKDVVPPTTVWEFPLTTPEVAPLRQLLKQLPFPVDSVELFFNAKTATNLSIDLIHLTGYEVIGGDIQELLADKQHWFTTVIQPILKQIFQLWYRVKE